MKYPTPMAALPTLRPGGPQTAGFPIEGSANKASELTVGQKELGKMRLFRFARPDDQQGAVHTMQ
jgi:hypothetical protein